MSNKWKFNTFDCMQHPVMCLWAWCVPCGGCCMQAYDARECDKDNKNACLIACLMSCCLGVYGATFNRYQVRNKLQLEGTVPMDFLCHCCCGCCSVVQEWQQVMDTKHGKAKINIWEVGK
mmetsp:Transcript_7382/g.7242  ORF Transcript_7382/g.7242 Transcript_7382/m.7242 type:complete len:120 (-) Transcript_7382:42-401(-)